jgi:two-component system CheB/CheR fusion protein
VNSEGDGRGSEFTLSLPALQVPISRESEQDAAAPADPEVAASHTVLVVDDNRDGAETIAELLALWGHRPHTAHDGHAALRLVEELRPDVLLLDLGLPGLDGYGVVRALGDGGLRDGLLLVAMTGYGQEADHARTAAAGFDRHLVKPVDPGELRLLLAAHSRVDAASRDTGTAC